MERVTRSTEAHKGGEPEAARAMVTPVEHTGPFQAVNIIASHHYDQQPPHEPYQNRHRGQEYYQQHIIDATHVTLP